MFKQLTIFVCGYSHDLYFGIAPEQIVKFKYCEKATKFKKISHLFLKFLTTSNVQMLVLFLFYWSYINGNALDMHQIIDYKQPLSM